MPSPDYYKSHFEVSCLCMNVCLKLPLKKAAITNKVIILQKENKAYPGCFFLSISSQEAAGRGTGSLGFQRAVTK